MSETADDIRRALGEALRRRREGAGRTLTAVASEAGCSPAHLSEVERGRKDVSTDLLVAIVHALGVRPSQLLREVADHFAADGTGELWPVEPRAQLDLAAGRLSGDALRTVAAFSTFLANGGEPARRRIGFMPPQARR